MNPFDTAAITSSAEIQEVINNGPFPIRFPPKGLPQDEEWCEVEVDGHWKRIRFHDYDQVYSVPGLYETIFYRTLRCNSPNRVSNFLNDVMSELGIDAGSVRALDVGAGNGMSGEALQSLGIRKIVAVDVLNEAKAACMRDRPWVYDHYLAANLIQLNEETHQFLVNYRFNVLCTIAALGFGDIPPLAFFNAFNFIADGGLVAFNIRDEFLKKTSGSPFSRLITSMMEQEYIELEVLKRYQHRLNTRGEPLYYVGIVARKNRSMPIEILK